MTSKQSKSDPNHQASKPHMHAGQGTGSFANASVDYNESVTALQAANARMHEAMSINPSGDAGRDFAAGMLAHHEGAIEMAQIELRYGKDPELRQLAKAIITAQEQEIKMMREWLARERSVAA